MNPLALDTIYARRPALTYVSPAICEAVFSSSSFPSLILDAVDPRNRNKVTGLVVTYTGGGDYLINFNNYPGALCYSVYKLNDATDPFSGYVLIAECISDQPFNPDDWVFPKPPPGTSVCYAFTVITADGESDFSDLICVFTPPDPDVPPLPGTGCILNASPLPDGEVDEPYSVTLLPNGPADVPQWTIWAGALPPGLSLNIDSGVISGTPTEGGDFSFTVLLTKNGGGSCTKEFQISIESTECGDPDNIKYEGQSGIIASGLNVVLPASEFRFGAPNDGYNSTYIADGIPKVAVVTYNWGNPQPATVLVAPVPDTSGTALTLETGEGALFPSLPIMCQVSPGSEIVQVTGVVGDVLTIVRAQEGTLAEPIGVGATLTPTQPFVNWIAFTAGYATDGESYAGQTSAFNATTSKTVRVPIYPSGYNEYFPYAVAHGSVTTGVPPGSGALMGDCTVSTTMVCVDESEVDISWSAPDLAVQGDGFASASGTATSFTGSVVNPGAAGDGCSLTMEGTFTVLGDGVGAKINLTVSNHDLDGSELFPRFSLIATSNIDGQVWASFSNDSNVGEWFSGNGSYVIPLVFGCTPGSVITLVFEIEDNAGGGTQSITVQGDIVGY